MPEAVLLEEAAGGDPLALFRRWLADAESCSLLEPAAAVLATATAAGVPSARVVLLRSFDESGFVFYTNYQSRKGDELAANPHACLVFFWDPLRRQVRVEGRVEKLSAAESDAYFRNRPVGHQLSAALSPQSAVVPDRAYLEQALAELTRRYQGQEVPRPDNWGGYRVRHDSIEFWQGRDNRLHDRLRFRRHEGGWQRERLAP